MKLRRLSVVLAAALLTVVLMPATAAYADTHIKGSNRSGCYTIKKKGHNDVLVHVTAGFDRSGYFAGYGMIGVGYGCEKPNTTPVSYMALYHVTLMTAAGKTITSVKGGNTRTKSHVGATTQHVRCGSHTVKFRIRATVGYAYTDGDYAGAFNVYGPPFTC